MIDTHAHVHDRQFDGDRDEVVARARDAGVAQIVTVGCDVADSARAIATAKRYGLKASVGIHPHEAKDVPADLDAAFDALLEECVVAIGETGLDYYYDHSPRDAQARALRAQIRYARKRDLTVIFHHRDAYDDFIAILREEFAPGMRGVIHCFTGDATQAKTYVEEFGLRLGIGGVLTFKTADALREAVRAVGLGPLILETDCPYLAPIPHRGKRNEPAFIGATAARLADVLDVPLDDVLTRTNATTRALFKLS
ncbi:MAG TPA: TatD family hydrolase [Candidatus Baltobacteraceae bacterium]